MERSRTGDTLVPVVEAVQIERSRTEMAELEDSGAEKEVADATGIDDGNLRVIATDKAGHPLGGVPLGIFQLTSQSNLSRFIATTTGANGLGVFKGAAAELAEIAKSRPGDRFQVGLDVPGIDLEFVDLDLQAWPQEVVRLTVPDSGTLEIHIEDEEGAPVVAHNFIYVFPLFEKPSHPGYLHRGNRKSVLVTGVSKAILPFVPAGTKLRLTVHEQGLAGKGKLEVEALQPGEKRTVKMVVRGALPFVFGRVVLPNGEPVDAQFLKVKARSSGVSRVEIQPGGGFLLPLSRWQPAHGARVTVRLRVQLPGPNGTSATGPTFSGEFDAAAPSTGEPTDVGDVVMHKAPVFASGIVIDEAGDPVQHANLSIYEKFNQRSDPEDFGWNISGLDYGYTDASGHFQMVGDKPPGEYAIGARARGYVGRGLVRFQSGTSNLVMHLDRERFLSGTLLLPDGADHAECVIVATTPGATREQNSGYNVKGTVAPGGKFTLTGLRRSAVSLTLKYGEEKVELASLHEILPTDSTSQKPRQLDPWDLREELRRIVFDVRLSDGSPATRGLVTYGKQLLPLQGGRVEVLAKTEENDDVFVVAPGHLPSVLTVRALPQEVHLLRGIPVRVAIDSRLPDPPDGTEVTFSLVRNGQGWIPWTAGKRGHRGLRPSLWREEISVQPGETEWTLYVPAEGSYRPSWRVKHPVDPTARGRLYDLGFTTIRRHYEINVEEVGTGSQRWLVQPDLVQARKAFAGEE